MRILTVFIGFMIGLSAFAEEDYYVWIDENGVTNYSQRNPQGVEAQHITRDRRFGEQIIDGRRPGAPPPEQAPAVNRNTTASNTTPTPTAGDADSDVDVSQERAAIQAKIDETKRQNCEIGRRNLAQLEAFARVRVKGPDGQERVLSDEEHQQQIQEARQLISENCTG